MVRWAMASASTVVETAVAGHGAGGRLVEPGTTRSEEGVDMVIFFAQLSSVVWVCTNDEAKLKARRNNRNDSVQVGKYSQQLIPFSRGRKEGKKGTCCI